MGRIRHEAVVTHRQAQSHVHAGGDRWLGAAGFFFKQLSQHHFDQLDSHALEEKLHASRSLLEVLGDLSKLRCLAPALQALLGGHSELPAQIYGSDGHLLFTDTGGAQLVISHPHTADDGDLLRERRVWHRKIGEGWPGNP